MTDRYGAFRLNFEQQQKQAKDLLKAARVGNPAPATYALIVGQPSSGTQSRPPKVTHQHITYGAVVILRLAVANGFPIVTPWF